jgi:nucleoside-triphosphatase THEP1
MKKPNKTNKFIFDMTSEEVQSIIQQYLPIRKKEKDKFGEVFTPISLINELLTNIPVTIWKNPETKWLDPANGIGNFSMIIYQRLMQELPDTYNKNDIHYHTKKEKSNHIIKNMLYMIEINPKNVKISQEIFGPNANICCCNFLDEEKWQKQFYISKSFLFDVIVCNPPFQTELHIEGRTGAHGNKTLWDKFIKKSLDLLVDNGFLAFINPPLWRRPENELYDLMTKQNQLIYLHIFGEKQGHQLFNVLQRVDLYVIEKKTKYKNTIIIDELGNTVELNLSNWPFIPNYNFDNIKKILKNENDGIPILYHSTLYEKRKPYVKEEKTGKYKYPIVHSMNKKGIIFSYTDDKSRGHFGQSKVLLGLGRNQYPVNDYDGKYGMSLLTFGIPISSKKQGDDIVKAINSSEFKEIIKATKWTSFQTDWRMFKYFKPDFYEVFLETKTKSKTVKRKGIQKNSKTVKTHK